LPENSVDKINPRKFVGPACVVDVSAEVAKDPDFLLTVDRVKQGVSAGLESIETLYLTDLMATADAAEGINAFMEKRPPAWRDE